MSCGKKCCSKEKPATDAKNDKKQSCGSKSDKK